MEELTKEEIEFFNELGSERRQPKCKNKAEGRVLTCKKA